MQSRTWAAVLAALTLTTALVAVPSSTASAAVPPIAVTGGKLTAGGAPFTFSGMNVYNANSDGTCWDSMATSLDAALTSIGPDIKVLRSWFFQDMATSNGVRDWTAFDRTISAAAAHGKYVLPVLGNQWNDCDTGYGFKTPTWYTSGYKTPDPKGTVSYRDWVAEFSARYGQNPNLLAIELLNEPETSTAAWPVGTCPSGSADLLRTWAADVSAVAKAAGARLISLGTIGSGQCGTSGTQYADLHALPDVNLCSYHDYSPTADIPGDQWNGLQQRLDQCATLGKPLYVGETGIRPSDVGGTLPARADRFTAKLATQVAAGSAGLIAWAWNSNGSDLNGYNIGPGDPALAALRLLPAQQPAEILYDKTSDLWTMAADGSNQRLLRRGRFGSWSPDGTQIAYADGPGLYVVNADGSSPRLIREETSNVQWSAWSPDSTRIAYTSNGLKVVNADGSNVRTLDPAGSYPSWSPDGTEIAYTLYPDPYHWDLAIAPADGTGTPRNVTNLAGLPCQPSARFPTFSPDGQRLAFSYNSNCGSAYNHIAVINTDGTGMRELTDIAGPYAGDFFAAWSPDGTKILFRREETAATNYAYNLYTVPSAGGAPTRLTAFSGCCVDNPRWRPVRVDSDGDGILDTVDTNPQVKSSAFSDGTTSGSIGANPSALSVRVIDAPAPDGVRVVVGGGTGQVTLTVCGFTVRLAAGSDVTFTCGSILTKVRAGSAQIVLGGGITVVTITAGSSAKVSANTDGSYSVSEVTGGAVTVVADGATRILAPGTSLPRLTTWRFIGFSAPVDKMPVVNAVKAGQAVPLRWQLLNSSGAPITTLTTAKTSVRSKSCSSGATIDQLEEVASGASGLQNLGGGYYQLNWATPKNYAGSCKTLLLDLGEGVTRDADFILR